MKRLKFPMSVYLSGAMTGIEDFNRPAFDQAAAELRAKGFTVFVPGEEEEYDDIEYINLALSKQKREFYLTRDLFWILEQADVVVVLPDWDESEGAKLELAVAQAIGTPIFQYPKMTLMTTPIRLRVDAGYTPFAGKDTPYDC